MSGFRCAIKVRETEKFMFNLLFGMPELEPLIEVVSEINGLSNTDHRVEYCNNWSRMVRGGYQSNGEKVMLTVKYENKTGEIEVSLSIGDNEVFAVV